jgi:hypothetical protein
LNSTVRHPDNTDGRTHASNVNADEKSKSLASATVTQLDDPLNDNAPPNLPAALQLVDDNVPTWPFPLASATLDPDPSLKPHAATKPEGGGALFETVTDTDCDDAEFPAASRATAVTTCEPSATERESHDSDHGAVTTSAPTFTPSSRNCTPTTPTSSDADADNPTTPETVDPPTGDDTDTVGGVTSGVTPVTSFDAALRFPVASSALTT